MNLNIQFLYAPITARLIFSLSLVSACFWISACFIDVYKNPVVGVIFEMIWLPMILSTLIIPIFSILIILKKGSKKTLPLLSFLLTTGTIIFLIFYL